MPRAVLATLALAPFVLTILTPIVLRNPVTPEMTVGIFPLLPLLLIEIAGLRDTNLLRWLALRLALVVTQWNVEAGAFGGVIHLCLQ